MASIQFCGNVGKAPEIKKTKNGKEYCVFSVADNVGWGDNKRTVWYMVKVWGAQVPFCSQYLKKGSKVFIQGNNEPYTFEGDNGLVAINEVSAYNVDKVSKDAVSEGEEASSKPAKAVRGRGRAAASDDSDELDMPTA